MVGAVESMVNVHVLSTASALPATSLAPAAPPRTVAVYVTPGVSVGVGSNVATCVVALYDTDAAMLVDESLSTNVVAVIVAAFIASLKVAVTLVVPLTFVAPLAGDVAVTVGGVTSLLVVNDHVELAASALPAKSFTRGSVAPPRTVAV